MAYGEDFVHQQNASTYKTPYTFSAKEKDAETNFSYFGARYYADNLSIWLSVDPLADKYPSLSPYNYCANNPVMLVDPDGREIETTQKGWVAINRGLEATLGKNHPFSYDNKTGQVNFDENADLSKMKNSKQQEVLNNFKTLVQDKGSCVSVDVISNDAQIEVNGDGKSKTLRELEAVGVTINNGTKSSRVFLSDEPLIKKDGNLVPAIQREDEQGMAALHEISGHAYFFNQGQFNTEKNGYNNNRLTEKFDSNVRSIFIGRYLKNYIKNTSTPIHSK